MNKKTMRQNDLNTILFKHELWLDEEGDAADYSDIAKAEQANLKEQKLYYLIMENARLQNANLEGAILFNSDLKYANLHGANLKNAVLNSSDLTGAHLQGADLTNANWDYTSFPLTDNSGYFKTDMKLIYQLLAHICTLKVEGGESDEFKQLREVILPYALKSHQAKLLNLFK